MIAGERTVGADDWLVDLREGAFQFVADPAGKATLEDVAARNDWTDVTVGKSWDLVDQPKLRKGTVWLRARIRVDASLRNDRLALFVTAIGGTGQFYVNGQAQGAPVQYSWGFDVPGPTKIDISEAIRYGGSNEIIVRCDPRGAKRSIGLLGLVCLQRTLPFTRTSAGGIVPSRHGDGRYTVLLHCGDAVLSRGARFAFLAEELAAMKIPVYGLREDELIVLKPAGENDANKKEKVDIENLHAMIDDRSPGVRCAALPTKLSQYELLTVPLEVAGKYDNPFESKQIDVSGTITTPSGSEQVVHAYFAQDYAPRQVGANQEILLPVRGPGTPWRLRYRPTEPGQHRVKLTVKNAGRSASFDAGSFEVVPRLARGFLRISKTDPRFFEFDNGESFYGRGPSGWFRQTENWMFGGNTRWVPIEAHKRYYERKGKNESNYEYLARWHFGQLYLKGGYIDAYVVWKLDEAVRAMEANGLFWLTYVRPGAGRTYRNNPAWVNVMGNEPRIVRQNGLPPESELGFESAGRAELFHLVSRLADSPAIWIWTCSEEEAANRSMLPYHDFIRSLDVYKHPHAIGEGLKSRDLGSDVVILPGWYRWSFEKCAEEYAKAAAVPAPVLDTEGSVDEDLSNYNAKIAKIARGYHNHLWLCLFKKMAAGGTEWANVEVDANNLLFHAAALARFLKDEHLSKTHWEIVAAEVSDDQLRAFALQSDRKTLAWVVRPPSAKPDAATKATLKIPVARNGKCTVEFWDTQKGVVASTVKAEASRGELSCQLPEVAVDLAIKVVLP